MPTCGSTWDTGPWASRWHSRPAAYSPISWATTARGCRWTDSPFPHRRNAMAVDFYHGHGSPFSWRVWLALEAKNIPYELKVLSFQSEDTKKPEFRAINPRGQVPTVVDGGFAM